MIRYFAYFILPYLLLFSVLFSSVFAAETETQDIAAPAHSSATSAEAPVGSPDSLHSSSAMAFMNKTYMTVGAGYGTALSVQHDSHGAGSFDVSLGMSILKFMMAEVNYRYYYLTGAGSNYSATTANIIFDYKMRSGLGGFITFGIGGSSSADRSLPYGLALSWEFGLLFPLGKKFEVVWALENITYTSENKFTNYQMMGKLRYYFSR